MDNNKKKVNEIEFSFKEKIIEALIFASSEPISYNDLKNKINDEDLLNQILESLEIQYSSRGVNLLKINNTFAFRTSSEISEFLNIEKVVPKPLSRAATETLSIIAYHQPITRSEIENIRGVSLSRGTLDVLLELGWIQPGQRRSTPGNPLTWKTSNLFLDHFGLKEIKDLPGIDDLKNAGLLDKNKIIFNDETLSNE
ncbi:MAG: SMC-Scp complex subunit ScpB [Proteobacteria bacterium]|jgi:segregation and condensation protein B|nr:SMC-Scp complex subunit ScpB [Alphaproteobacteria bacterium]MBL6851115.1 SMC-Scp complex subunit ScpB [Alphaproteobacteria bacterium]MDA0916030.1 SMC-Scp complex subunit ScpB [Pseudomonadota bacterium]